MGSARNSMRRAQLTRRFDENSTKSLIYRGPVTKASDSSSDFVWEQPVGANSAAAAIGVTVIVFGLALAFNSMVIVPVSRVFRRIMKEPSSVTRSASAASLVSLRCDDFGKDTQPREFGGPSLCVLRVVSPRFFSHVQEQCILTLDCLPKLQPKSVSRRRCLIRVQSWGPLPSAMCQAWSVHYLSRVLSKKQTQ